MSATGVGQYLSRLGITFWLGEMLFFIVIFAPRVFKVLPRDLAGELQGHIFPPYYAAGLISAGLIAIGVLLRHFDGDSTLPTGTRGAVLLGLIAVAAVIFAFSLYTLTPEIDTLRREMHAATPDASVSTAAA